MLERERERERENERMLSRERRGREGGDERVAIDRPLSSLPRSPAHLASLAAPLTRPTYSYPLPPSARSGGPHTSDVAGPARFDTNVIERNYPFRGQKHEIYDGGVHVAGFIAGPLVPAVLRGSTSHALVHVTDWLPTIVSGAAGISTAGQTQPLDGHNLYDCLLGGEASSCTRNEIVLNIDIVCDTEGVPYFTECPAPKAGIIVGDMKLLAECYDSKSNELTGKVQLFNLTADIGETLDVAAAHADLIASMGARLVSFGPNAVAPYLSLRPWQTAEYFCAACPEGKPTGPNSSW